MSIGLIALLDDVAALAKLAAASLDDVAAAAAKASAKAAGVVIDDAAVTPRYVTGLQPERELPIIWRIAIGSLRNKLLLLLPAALLLSALAPWALTPLLMLGGSYLCFEGAEKLIEKWMPHELDVQNDAEPDCDPAHLETSTISGAIRTDLILSAEIMAIALASVAQEPIWEQAAILAVVSLLITAGVYGVVALIVKLDDIGLHLCKGDNKALQPVGRGMVQAMPHILMLLTGLGTFAMLWVGGGIVVHGLETLGIHFPGRQIGSLAKWLAPGEGFGSELGAWAVHASGATLSGVVLGGVMALAVLGFTKIRPAKIN